MPIVHFEIQPLQGVLADTSKNKWWIGVLALIVAIYVLISATVFWFDRAQALDWFSCLYFTVINVTTVGFGDIHPESNWEKALSIVNSLFGVIAFGFFVAILAAALQPTGFAGRGSIEQPAAPHPDPNAGPASASNAADPERAILGLLDSLNALIKPQDHPAGETLVHLELKAREARDAQIVVGIDVWVRRLS
jgi:hypothetical protein